MVDNFLVAVGAVAPLFILMSIGFYVKQKHWLTALELEHMNKMVFKIFFFFFMFDNIFSMKSVNLYVPDLMLFGGIGVLLTAVIAFVLVYMAEEDNPRRGTMVQAIFRSNYAILGIPIVVNIFGPEAAAIPTMMIMVVVPLYNVLAVLAFEIFRGGKPNMAHILLGVARNPMILGIVTGFVFKVSGIILPKPILIPVQQVANCTTPLSLIILGSSFSFSSIRHGFVQLVSCIAARLFVVPAIALGIAIEMGFRGVELVTLLVIFATPCAVASFAMAQQMNGDAELAGNCVVYTSALSCFTIFLWVFGLKTAGLF